MPIDPQARVFLDQLAAMNAPPFSETTPSEARAQMALMSALGSRPEHPAATEDRILAGTDGDVNVRIYHPAAAGSGPWPVVVYFHGGGWVIGDLDTHDATCQQLATRVPAIVVSVDYGLAPEHPFPQPVEDCWMATRWVSEHAAEFDGDPAHLAVAGDSAGGNLAAVVALRARDAGGPPIAFELLIYPATDLTRSLQSHRDNGQGYLLTTEAMDWFLGHYLGVDTDPRHPDASPLFVEDLSGLPPTLVITAEFDPLRDEGESYADRLRAAGVDVHATRYDGMIHGFFGLDTAFDSAGKAMDEAATALREALA